MYRLTATTFNDATWRENVAWRTEHQHAGCIYGNPRQIKDTIPTGSYIMVLEMHNDENKIKGIGLIKKEPMIDKLRVYKKVGNYNRFIYKGVQRIDIDDLQGYDRAIVEIFNVLLFKGKSHLKRIQGISELPYWILGYKPFDFVAFFRELFQRRLAEKKAL